MKAGRAIPVFFGMKDFSETLKAAAQGDLGSTEALLPLVYEELRRIAIHQMALQPSSHTLQPTALVHEAWLKLGEDESQTWQSKACFLSTAATAMRHILIDHARKKSANKRGGDQIRVDLEQIDPGTPEPDEVMLMVEDALKKLENIRPVWARIVVLRYYGGLTSKEISDVLGISERTVDRYWSGARAWLYKQMTAET